MPKYRRKNNYRKKKSHSRVWQVLLSLVIMGGIAFGVAWTWQNVQDSTQGESASSPAVPPEQPTEPEPGQSSVPDESESEPAPTLAVVDAPSTPEESVESSGETSEEAAEDEPLQQPEDNSTAPVTARAENEYFDDAIFFGDSISTGIPLYQTMPNAVVMAAPSITTMNANTKEIIDTDDGAKTLLDAALDYGDKGKVYIMLGGNGLDYDMETFLDGYRTFLTSVKAQYPGALIYLQAITPVTESEVMKKRYPSSNNEKIRAHNETILALAEEEGVYYLDIYSALADENGKLPDDASPLDGIHFTPEYYAIWFEYLRNHAVEQ